MKEFINKNDLINKFISVLIAVILWAIVMDIKNPTISASFNDIIVSYTSQNIISQNNNLVVISQQFPLVDIRLKGARDEIAQLSDANIIITSDLASIKEAGEYEVEYTIKLPFSEIEVINKYPQKLSVTIDEIQTKDIPVKVELVGTPQFNYFYDEIEAVEYISVTGPSGELSKISYAYTEIDTIGASKDIAGQYSIKLVDIFGEDVISNTITQSMTFIDVYSSVLKNKKVELVVDLVFGDKVREKSIAGYKTNPEYIYIYGLPENVENIKSVNLGEIDIDETQYGKSKFEFELPEIENIQYKSDTIDSVTATVLFTDYIEKMFLVTNLVYDETKLKPLTSSISISMFGKESDLDFLTANDIILTIQSDRIKIDDDGNFVKGVYEVPVQISYAENINFDIDVFESYAILVEVK